MYLPLFYKLEGNIMEKYFYDGFTNIVCEFIVRYLSGFEYRGLRKDLTDLIRAIDNNYLCHSLNDKQYEDLIVLCGRFGFLFNLIARNDESDKRGKLK